MYLLPAPTAPIMLPAPAPAPLMLAALTPSTVASRRQFAHDFASRVSVARDDADNRKREAQRQSWLQRSANAELPAPCRNAHNGVFRLYAAPLTLTSPDDSFGGFYPLSDKLPDVRVLTSGKSGPAFDAPSRERASWKDSAQVVGGAKFPMGNTSQIAREYAAGR